MAIIMDGKALAAKMQDQLQEKVARLKENEWIVPGPVSYTHLTLPTIA